MKRQPEEKNSQWMNYVVSLALVMAIAAILITIQGSSPAEAFGALIKGAVGSTSAISSSIRWSTPVLIATIAAIVAQKTGITNLGLEGQIYFGAFASAIAGAFLSEPRLIHIPIAILAGGLAGLAYAVLPAFLKAVFQINEMIVTLMLNYAAVLFTEYFTMMLMGLNSDTNPDQIATPEILESARLTQLLPPYQATTGIFIALGIALAVFAFFKFTRRGYEWRMLGRNSRFARYGGVRVVQNMTFAFLLSGFISGVCGAVEIMGPHLRFRNNFSTGMGWDGIMVALIAKNNPINAIGVSLLWGMIKAGSLNMERMSSVNRILVTLIQALFVIFITVDIRSLLKKVSLGKRRVLETGGAK